METAPAIDSASSVENEPLKDRIDHDFARRSCGEIFKSINKIMSEVDPISKDRQGHGYKFRGIDDAYNALHVLMAKHGVFTVPHVLDDKYEERQSKNGNTTIYRILKIKYTFYALDGSSVDSVVIGEGMDTGDKASNKAMSVAHKYALLQVFCIPTEESKDPELVTHEVLPDQRFVSKKYPKFDFKAKFEGTDKQKLWLIDRLYASYPEMPKSEAGAVGRALIGRKCCEWPDVLTEVRKAYEFAE